MLIENLIEVTNKQIEKKVPKKYLSKFQTYLEQNRIVIDPLTIFSVNLIAIFILIILLSLVSLILYVNPIYFLITIIPPPSFLILYVMLTSEKRREEIEKSTPDFLRQVSSMLRTGMSFESALIEFTNYGSTSLHTEIKRAILEIKMGKDFDSSLMSIPKRLNSKELNRTFRIVIEGRKSGGGLSDIIDSVAEDLRVINELKRERKSTVMMSVIFLIISAVIATPFTLGMVGVYTSFLTSLGREIELIKTVITAAKAYIIIHSSLVGFIIGMILYGDFKKGLKYSIPLVIVSYTIFYIVSTCGEIFLGVHI
ncbi:MAG: type II secretion system F family protein [Methanobrevibacter sp.]|jgi:flagellar protein FlaJ|nr:type II secretion system F family protein [Candidatus Methanovirga basalitermitum]